MLWHLQIFEIPLSSHCGYICLNIMSILNCMWINQVGEKTLMRFQVLMAASMKMAVLWDVVPCSVTEIDQCYRGACCLHLSGDCPNDGGSKNL
jgi:hypothetical protein